MSTTRIDRRADVDERRNSQYTDVVPGVVSINQYQTFQDILPEDKQLIVDYALLGKRLYCKGETWTHAVALLYYNNQYLPLQRHGLVALTTV